MPAAVLSPYSNQKHARHGVPPKMRNYHLAMGIFGTAASKLLAETTSAEPLVRDQLARLAARAVDAAEYFETEFHSRPSIPPPDLDLPDTPL